LPDISGLQRITEPLYRQDSLRQASRINDQYKASYTLPDKDLFGEGYSPRTFHHLNKSGSLFQDCLISSSVKSYPANGDIKTHM